MLSLILLTLLFAPVRSTASQAESSERILVVASTTSTENSGLFDHILPIFEEKTGVDVRVVAVGTGQAIRLAERGDADVLLVHHRRSEEEFVKQGFGVARHDVMVNDFVIVGPKDDPAGVRGEKDVTVALGKIAASEAAFASRGDDSGTHKRERELWAAAKQDPEAAMPKRYRSLGSGMGATLNVANELGAYTLSDRGTWLAFENREDLAVMVEGDLRLLNPYGVILVNPAKHPHVRADDGAMFIEWLLSDEGRAAIESFKVSGEVLFRAPARPEPPESKEPKESNEPEQKPVGGSR